MFNRNPYDGFLRHQNQNARYLEVTSKVGVLFDVLFVMKGELFELRTENLELFTHFG